MTQAIEGNFIHFQGLFNYSYTFAKEDYQEKETNQLYPVLPGKGDDITSQELYCHLYQNTCLWAYVVERC